MTGSFVLLLAAATGWLAVSASGACRGLHPRWASILLEATLGTASGLGVLSALFFALLWCGLDPRPAAFSALALSVTGAALLFFLYKPGASPELPAAPQWRWSRLCAAAFTVVLALFIAGFASAAEANPQGDWDAWALWNLRARFLSAPAAWTNAISPELSRTHPEYPLLWSGAIAHAWAVSGDSAHSAVPVAAAALVAVGTPLLLAATLAVLHSSAAGWLAALILVSTAAWWRQSQALYADIPLAFYLLASLATAALAQARGWHRPTLALSGLLASLAAWTKNEGLPFFVFCGLAVAWTARRPILAWLAGSLPVALLAAAFKLFLAPPARIFDATFLAEPGRALQVIQGLAAGAANLGSWTAHPLVLSALIAATTGIRPLRPLLWLLAPPLALLASAAVVLWGTPNDLLWQIGTTRERLLIQILPALLLAAFLTLRQPAPSTAAPAAGRTRSRASLR